MKNKCYGVCLTLSKKETIQVISQVQLTDSEENAIKLAIQTPFVQELLLDGYAISSKTVAKFDPSVAPINSETDGMVVRDFDNSLRFLYIDLRPEYTDDFKRDLQSLMTKYYPKIPPIYPELSHEQ